MSGDFDAIIIGAGPAGSSAALTLARQGWSVAIVEKNAFPRPKVCGEFVSATNIALLDRLGVGDAFLAHAGPKIRRVGLFAGETRIESRMPCHPGAGPDDGYGRALGRDCLDTLLLAAAAAAGSTVFQPWRANALISDGEHEVVTISTGDRTANLRAPVVIAAHGSWEPGPLPSQTAKQNAPSDLLGFKAHFSGASLPADLMPLFLVPGGYGGLVQADRGRISLSCCIRRDRLSGLRDQAPGTSAAGAVHNHLLQSCHGIREAIGTARLESRWLSAGPIRPGIRAHYQAGLFRIGNAAGESHPIIAEGISMAMQSAWLLARELARVDSRTEQGRSLAGERYAAAWLRQFSTRVYAAAVLAQLAVRPAGAELVRATVTGFPNLLGWGARLSGKTGAVPGLS